jgi:2-amino-4-hydroxy-6-hydroxymethyldihydropteridine diphosphokinase
VVKRKQLDKSHTLIFTPHFPYNTTSREGKRALLGLGGNIGDVLRRFEHLFWYMKRSQFLHVVETSPMLINPPFGYTEQDDFCNALMLVETDLAPKALLRYVLRVEKLFGRKRSFQDAPRTLDIDIIFYENITMETKTLTLPHPGWMKRTSVLIPLKCLSRQGRSFYEKPFSGFRALGFSLKNEMNERELGFLLENINNKERV